MSAESLKADYLNVNEAVIFTVPKNRKVEFTSLYLANRDSVAHRFSINCTVGTNKVSIGSGQLLAGESAEVFDIPRTFKAGESLSGFADLSNQLSYLLVGEQFGL